MPDSPESAGFFDATKKIHRRTDKARRRKIPLARNPARESLNDGAISTPPDNGFHPRLTATDRSGTEGNSLCSRIGHGNESHRRCDAEQRSYWGHQTSFLCAPNAPHQRPVDRVAAILAVCMRLLCGIITDPGRFNSDVIIIQLYENTVWIRKIDLYQVHGVDIS